MSSLIFIKLWKITRSKYFECVWKLGAVDLGSNPSCSKKYPWTKSKITEILIPSHFIVLIYSLCLVLFYSLTVESYYIISRYVKSAKSSEEIFLYQRINSSYYNNKEIGYIFCMHTIYSIQQPFINCALKDNFPFRSFLSFLLIFFCSNLTSHNVKTNMSFWGGPPFFGFCLGKRRRRCYTGQKMWLAQHSEVQCPTVLSRKLKCYQTQC